MNTTSQLHTIFFGLLVCLLAVPGAMAQSTFKGPVRITSTQPTGSGPDVVMRIVAEKLQAKWGKAVIVDPKPGGAGVLALSVVKAAPPTGNDLGVADVGNLSINPLIFKKLAYDPETDFVPVALLYRTAFFIAVAADGPYKSVKDLLAAATNKSRPLKYGSNAVGGPLHLAAARLDSALGADMLHVPYKETSQLYVAVSTGEVDWAYGSIATAGPLVRAGKLRFIAIADRTRSPAMPDVPTLAEAGGPKNVDAASWVSLVAPRGTPGPVVAEINQAVNEALALPDVKERLATYSFYPGTGSAQQLADIIRDDRARYAELLKRMKVSID